MHTQNSRQVRIGAGDTPLIDKNSFSTDDDLSFWTEIISNVNNPSYNLPSPEKELDAMKYLFAVKTRCLNPDFIEAAFCKSKFFVGLSDAAREIWLQDSNHRKIWKRNTRGILEATQAKYGPYCECWKKHSSWSGICGHPGCCTSAAEFDPCVCCVLSSCVSISGVRLVANLHI